MHHSPYSDGIEGKAFDARLMKKLLMYLKPYKLYVFLAFICLLISNILPLFGPYLIKVGIDKYIVPGNMEGLNDIVFVYLIILVLSFVFLYLQIVLTNIMGYKAITDLRVETYDHILHLPVQYFDKHPVGAIMTRVTNDAEVLNELFKSGIVTIFGDIFSIIGIVSFMCIMNLKLALITFITIPLLFYTSVVFKKKVRVTFRLIRGKLGAINAQLQEFISGIQIIQSYNKEKFIADKFDETNKDYLDAYIKTIFYYSIFFPVVEFISALALALIIWYGGGQVIQGAIQIGVLIAFIQYVEKLFRPLSDLVEKYNILQSSMAASERIFEILDTKTEEEGQKGKVFEGLKEKIEFKDITFAYDTEPVLKNVSFEIKKGKTIAVVGATGSGKTTLINLLLKFYSLKTGEILVDNNNLSEIDSESWRNKVALISQDPFVFNSDIEFNINLYNKKISDEKMDDILNRTQIKKFLKDLPNGIHEQLYERGGKLSAGQRQLISFARALAKDPEILILDEATANIDTETEMMIQKAIENLIQDRTSIIIAHRLFTVRHADWIIVLHKGEIKEQGTHETLYNQKGIYYKLCELQFGEA